MGPTPQNIQYRPWATDIQPFRCPSDPGFGLPSLGRTNYGACIEDSFWEADFGPYVNNPFGQLPKTEARVEAARAAHRGFFMPFQKTSFGDCLDGLSNTIAMGELLSDAGDNSNRTQTVEGGMNANPPGITLPAIRNNPSISVGLVDPARPRFWQANFENVTRKIFGRGYRWEHRWWVRCRATIKAVVMS